MARKLRVEYGGAIYHVMNRGDRREEIFREDADRERFLETLGEVCARTGWEVHALKTGRVLALATWSFKSAGWKGVDQ
jgi:REP element-mobilizing transposase RayT